MAKAKKAKINTKDLIDALASMEELSNIPVDVVKEALKKSIVSAYCSRAFDVDGVQARCEINDKDEIEFYWQRTVVEKVEDELDLPLDISLEDAKKTNKNIQVGDIYETLVPLETFKREVVQQIKTTFIQNIKEAQKTLIFDKYKILEGSITTGTVEKCEEGKYSLINLGLANGYMSLKDGIPGEKYRPGDRIKVYVKEVSKESSKPSIIAVSRSDARFLFKLFSSEILEIESGDVYIRKIARIPGIRSKIAVSSKIEGLDAAGTCIGKNGTRIQKIVEQLANGQEKIDVIQYYDDPLMMIKAALSPAKVEGIAVSQERILVNKFNKETKRKEGVMVDAKVATVVVSNPTYSLAIGIKGQNAFLAQKLSKFDKLEIKKVDDALGKIPFKRMEEIEREYNLAHNINVAKPVETFIDDEEFDFDNRKVVDTVVTPVKVVEESKVTEEVKPVETKVSEEVYVSTYKPKVQAEHISVVEEAPKEEETKVEVKDPNVPSKKELKRQAEEEAKAKQEEQKKNYMPVYTEEELREIEESEALEEEEEEIDYDEFEDYYDQY